MLTSCDTPVGQGAAWGAATGAIIGGAATGNARAASIGAAAGAAAGALTGKIIQENQAAQYGPPPPGGFPYARWAGRPGFFYSPYTGRVYDLGGVLPGGLTRDAVLSAFQVVCGVTCSPLRQRTLQRAYYEPGFFRNSSTNAFASSVIFKSSGHCR
jgi:Glycine zipper